MDSSQITWFSEMDSFECDLMDSFDEEVAALLSQDAGNINEAPANNWTAHVPCSSPIILNFDNTATAAAVPAKRPHKKPRPPSQTYDHIIAERKRREQLSQRFLALSTIVPGLKKMDKTSVLGDAIKYLKHLQERVKSLEEQATKQTMESVVLVKKSQIMVEDEDEHHPLPLPEIEARFCSNHVLLRVHCEKHKGVLVNLLTKLEKLNLAVITTNVTPFGTLALDITIVAEMEKEFSLTLKEVVRRLRAAI